MAGKDKAHLHGVDTFLTVNHFCRVEMFQVVGDEVASVEVFASAHAECVGHIADIEMYAWAGAMLRKPLNIMFERVLMVC